MAKAFDKDAQVCTVLWAGQGRAGHTREELPDDLIPRALDQVAMLQQPAIPISFSKGASSGFGTQSG
jgi:hypothetical protein